MNTRCPSGKVFLEIHNHKFPNHTKDQDWLEQKSVKDAHYQDPHGCRDSCSEETRGPNCQACSNRNYYRCLKSQVCIHEDLLCDGHPQCQFGEDELFETCYDIYIHHKVVPHFATYSCNSLKYPGVDTVATSCDGVPECYDRYLLLYS